MTTFDPGNTDNGNSFARMDCQNVLFGTILLSKPSGAQISATECQTVLNSLTNRLKAVTGTPLWIHVAATVTKSTNTAAVYVNGLRVSTTSIAYANNTGTNLRIGAGTNESTPSQYLSNGSRLDDFRFYNTVLTNNQILEFYNTSLTDGNVIVLYKFNDSSTGMLLDSSGNGYTLTTFNNPTFDSVNYMIDNGSIYFNGNSQYAELPSSVNPYNIWNGNGISFTCWFRMSTSSGNWSKIFDISDGTVGSNPSNWISIGRNGTNNYIYFEIGVSGTGYGTKSNGTTTAVIVDNNWHHIVWTISITGVWSIYIDSVYINPNITRAIPNIIWTKRWLGRSGFSGDGWYVGNIDDFRIYNKVLNQTMVNVLYTGYYSKYFTNLIAWYKFEDSVILMLQDSSASAYTLINTGSATLDTTVYRKGYSSIYFNGTNQYVEMPSGVNPYTIWNQKGISFSIWFKIPTSTATTSRIFSFGDGSIGGSSVNSLFCAKNSTANTLYFESRTNGVSSSFTTTNTYIDNTWHHMVLIINTSGNWTLYMDNVSITTNFTNKPIPNANWTKRYIARSESDSALYTTGNIDDFRIFNKVLDATEVRLLYYYEASQNIGSVNYLINNVRYTAYSITSNIPIDEARTTSNLNRFLINTSNDTLNNWNAKGYLITTTSNDISIQRANTSNNNIIFLRNNSNSHMSVMMLNSNQIALLDRFTSNQVASNINFTSNILQAYYVVTSNQYTTHNTNTSNFTRTYFVNSSNSITNNLTFIENTLGVEFNNYFQNCSNTFMTSSNWMRNFWTTTCNTSMSNMINTSNFIGNRINTDSNIISNRIQNLTLDQIYPGVNYQYIVNNVFNSNLNIPHHLIVGSLRVQDIDLSINNDSVLPNQQLKTYINELTSNTIFKADVFQSAFDNILSSLEVNWSNYTSTKQDIVASSLQSIAKTTLAANIALVTDAQGNITKYTDSDQNVFSKFTIQYLNNELPLQTSFDNFNTNSSNMYTCNVLNALLSYSTNLSNYLVSNPNCNV
jgi:hypothetical protein